MVTVPVSLCFVVVLSFCGAWQSIVVRSEQAVEIARFASLSDVTDAEREAYLAGRLPSATLRRITSPEFCSFEVRFEENLKILAFLEPTVIPVTREVSCEGF
jgi:hypothetical protein